MSPIGTKSGSSIEALIERHCPDCQMDQLLTDLGEHLIEHPESLGKITPGYELVRQKMTPKERGTVALPAANAARKRRRNQRNEDLRPHLEAMYRRDPAISYGQIAQTLDELKISPPRTRLWNPRTIANIVKELGLTNEQNEA